MHNYMTAARARLHFTRERLLGLVSYDLATGSMLLLETGEEIVGLNNHGYRWFWAEGAALLVHRVAWRLMTGEWPPGMVDHIDGNRQHNAWANLRETDHSRNAQNMHGPMSTNRTGFLGVHLNSKGSKPYRSAIEIDDRKLHLGSFDTAEEAYATYLKAKAQLHPVASLAWPEPA